MSADVASRQLPLAPFTLLCDSDLADTSVFYFKKFFPYDNSDGLLMTVLGFIDDSSELGLPTDPLAAKD